MTPPDDFSTYYAQHLEGRYDCVDRLVFNGYFFGGQQGGGMRNFWRALHGSDQNLDQQHLQAMAGTFSRRVRVWAKAHRVPLIDCAAGQRKHDLAQQYLPQDPDFTGLFLILVAKAPALVWEVTHSKNGTPHLERQKPWPYVNHYHFHLIDKEWGHLTIKMSGHPPFGTQIMLNGHEWVERAARQQGLACEKTGNCFTAAADLTQLDALAATLGRPEVIGQVAQVIDRWIYSACLCFGLTTQEQERTAFRYDYSCYQLEYSRNLLFVRGTVLDELFQSLIDRTRGPLDIAKLKTIFGCKKRPHHRRKSGRVRVEKIVDESVHDLTVFKVHFDQLTLKIYDKGERVLRIEVIVNHVKALKGGKRLEKLSTLLEKIQRLAVDFLGVVQAAHESHLDAGLLDSLSEPTQRGSQRLAGVNTNQARMRAVLAAVLALAARPGGFPVEHLSAQMQTRWTPAGRPYGRRQAAYDLRKLRGKNLVERVERTRRYRVGPAAVGTLAALVIVREKVLKPVLTGATRRGGGHPPKHMAPIDQHYANLCAELERTLHTLGLAA